MRVSGGGSGIEYSVPFPVLEYRLLNPQGVRMAFSLNTRKAGAVVIIDMSGRLSIGEAVLLLRSTIRRFVEDGTLKFVLNLGNVSHIDSAGLGELVTIYTSVRNRGGDAKLLNLDKKAKDLLQMTKLLTVFDTYNDEAKAVQALG
jgi:anti-sigma B factor antagonist